MLVAVVDLFLGGFGVGDCALTVHWNLSLRCIEIQDSVCFDFRLHPGYQWRWS